MPDWILAGPSGVLLPSSLFEGGTRSTVDVKRRRRVLRVMTAWGVLVVDGEGGRSWRGGRGRRRPLGAGRRKAQVEQAARTHHHRQD